MLSTFVYLRSVLTGLGDRLERLSDERGQTAAEYVGILVVVAAILGAIFGLGLEEKIGSALETAINKIVGNY